MSGYPSIISPLMDEQGLILSEALNQEAQTALALSATNEADIVVLQETALQLAGDPATYTGLPETDMSLNGNLKMNTYDIENVNEITASNVNCNNILNLGSYAISGISTGVNIDTNITTPGNITCNTLNYSALNPPISGGSQNIEQVLITGSNANGQSLTGLTNLSSVNVQSTNAGTTAVLKANNIGMYNDNGNTLKAVLDPSGNFFAQNYYLYGRAPSDFAITNNKNILTTGNITSNTITTQSIETPALTSSAGYIFSPSLVLPTGSVSAKNSSGNGFIETNEMRVYRDAGTYSGYFNNQGTCFMSRYQLIDVPEETFNIALDGSAQFTNINNNGTLNTTKIELAETLQDASSSVGTAGQVLSSTGTGTQWITPSAGGTPSLSDVMTVGNTASTILDMNNNTVDNAFSVYTKTLYSVDNVEGGNIYSNNLTIQDGTGTPQLTITPVGDITTSGTIQSADITVGTTPGQQVILSNIGEVRCSSLNIPSDALTPAFSITNDGTAFTTNLEIGGTLNLNGPLLDKTGFNGNTLYLRSTGDGVVWNAVNTPTLFDVMRQGNVAGNNLNMDKRNFYNAITVGLASYFTPKEIQLQMNATTPETLDIKSRSEIGLFTPANISCNLVNGTDINYRPTYDYFVAKNGSDTNTGSVLSPFLTIQKAIDVCEAFTDNVPRNVNIYYGSYNENLTISKSRIAFNGSNEGGSRADTGCSLNGTITINVSSGLSDMNNNNIYFNNLLINGLITDTSTTVHRVAIKNCYLYGNNTVLSFVPSTDYRLFVDYCYLNNEDTISTNSLISCGGSGMVSFSNNQMTTKSKGHVVSVQDSCRIDVFALNVLTNSNTGADCLAIMKLSNTTNFTTYTISQNGFIYSSTTSKSSAAPYYSCGILLDTPSLKNNNLIVTNNQFSMAGINTAGYTITSTLNSDSQTQIFYANNVAISSSIFPYAYVINSSGSALTKTALLASQ
jgi:hypothetical protein